MGGLFSSPKPPPPPAIKPPVPMPVPDDVQVKAGMKRKAQQRVIQSGRESTFLTTKQSEKLGG